MTPFDFRAKGQGYNDLVGKNSFLLITCQPMGPWPLNCIGALVLASRWSLLILGLWVKGQGNIDLVGKNGFRSITWQPIGSWPSDFIDALVLASWWPLLTRQPMNPWLDSPWTLDLQTNKCIAFGQKMTSMDFWGQWVKITFKVTVSQQLIFPLPSNFTALVFASK
jgi:hypothetical protein